MNINFSRSAVMQPLSHLSQRFKVRLDRFSNLSKLIPEKILKNEIDKGEVIQQSNLWVRCTTSCLVCSAAFAIVWLSFAKTDEVVTVSGKLEPIGSVQNIQMPMGGIASKVLVNEGEEVKANQILILLDAETTQKRLDSLSKSIELKNEQLNSKLTELLQYQLLNDEDISIIGLNIGLQKEILERYKYLKEQGAFGEMQYLQQLNKVTDLNSKLNTAKLERVRQEAAQNQQIQQIKSELKSLEAQLTEASVNLRYQVLRSPVDGIVFDLQPTGEGYVAQSTETIMKIVPYDKLQANVEIPSRQIGFVKVGMPVDLSIDSFPASDFGVLYGQLKSIGSDALPPSQIDNRSEYRFPAIIKLDSQHLITKNELKLPLQVGMSLTSNIKLRKVSYLQLLLGTFQDKVDSLRKI